MKKLVLLLSILVVSMSVFANGLSLNSIGPKALAMGGAFVGLADDGTAIYWNPAGLVDQPTMINIAATDIIPIGTYYWDVPAWGPFNPNIDADMEMNHYISPNLFFNMSKGNLALGLGIFVPAGLGAEWNGEDLKNLSAGQTLDWRSKIGVIDFAPAIAYKFSDKFSLGVTGNIYYAMFDLDRPAVIEGVGAFQYSEESTGLGYGVSVGALYKASKIVNLGLTVRTSTTVTMDGTAENPAFAQAGVEKSDFEREVTWPLWVGAGAAFKLHEKFLITVDAQFSRWSELDELETDYDEDIWAQATAASGDDKFILDWENALMLRMGWEFQATPCIALRGGYYYDPAPAPDETLNILFPQYTYSALTGGFGFAKEKFAVDFGLEYLFGMERNPKMSEENMPGSHQMDILAWSLGVGYKF